MSKTEFRATIIAICFAVLSSIMFFMWRQSEMLAREAILLNEQYYVIMQEYKLLADECLGIVIGDEADEQD